jgi:RNA polymerase sigma-70 factor (ECF subfamily)
MDAALEQRCLDACRRGRRDAFRPLVDEYFGASVRLAGSLVGAGDAEDVAQEAFVAAYGAIRTHRPGQPFYPWLRGILVNRARVFIRGRNRARARVARAAEQPGHWTHSARGGDRLTSDLLMRALQELDGDDRLLVVLKHVEGYTYDELAAQLAIPRGTVMSRLYRARRRLRDHLAALEAKPGRDERRGDE